MKKLLLKLLKQKLVFLSVAILLINNVSATFDGSEDLRRSIINGYNRNYQFKAKIDEFESVKQQKYQAYSLFLPSADFEYRKGEAESEVAGSKNDGDTETKSLVVAQPLFKGGSNLASYKIARDTLEAQAAVLAYEEGSLLSSIIVAYMNVARDKELLKAAQKNETVLKEHWDIAKRKFEFGEVTITDVSQSEARYSDAKTNRIKAEGNLIISKENYRSVTLTDPDKVSFDIEQNIVKLPDDLKVVIEKSLLNNYEIVANKYKLEIAKHNVKAERGNLLPSVNFVASKNEQETISSTSPTDSETYEFVVSVPLFRGGREVLQVKEAKYDLKGAEDILKESEQQVMRRANEFWHDLKTAESTLESTAKSVEASSLVLRSITKEQQFGTRTMTDVLDAEKDLFNAESNLVIAKYNFVVSSYNLLNVMGKLTMKDLGLLDKKDSVGNKNQADTRNKVKEEPVINVESKENTNSLLDKQNSEKQGLQQEEDKEDISNQKISDTKTSGEKNDFVIKDTRDVEIY